MSDETHISKHLQNFRPGKESAKPSTNGQRNNPEAISLTAKVWQSMTEMFDDKWVRKHGEIPSQAWTSMMSKMTPEQIQTGIRAAMEKAVNDFRETGESWPPSLPEFIALCTPIQPQRLPEYKMLPTPKANPITARAALAIIRDVIRGKLA